MSISPQDYTKYAAHGLLGEPDKALTTNSQLRFGTHGSITVEITGDERDNCIRYGIASPGGSDLIGWRSVVVTPEMVTGRIVQFVAIEVKDRGVPTNPQESFLGIVAGAGGRAIVAWSVEDAVRGLS